MHGRFTAEEADVGLGIVLYKVFEDLVEVFQGRVIGESHGVTGGKAYGAALIAEVGDVDCDGVGLSVELVVAGRAVQRALLFRWFVVASDIPFPSPLACVLCDQ
jgi:hypothetical protein